ncbi:COX assembly mitochondrial protein homolog isoform X1 [Loxodonta africana]|uniref:COX assembly mitochondrial protein homolog isoform X1 n=1 Tax=Loxodonta africana TaxID=9785 RepID=UPI0030CCAC05
MALDPAEQHLRHVEKDVLIPKIMREKAKERCSEQVQGNTTLLAKREEELKHLLMKIKDYSLQCGLCVNVKETKILTTGPISNIMINREKIEVVKDFILLVSTVNTHGSSSQDIK